MNTWSVRSTSRTRVIGRIAVIVLAVAVGAGATWFWMQRSGAGGGAQQQARRAAGATLVVVAPAVAGDIGLTFDAVGTLRASEAVTVTSKTNGIVKKIAFEEGQEVQAGQVLVELDDTEARANFGMTESTRRDLEQQLTRSRALLTTQAVAQARVDQLLVQMQGAEAAARAAQARLQDLSIRAPFAGVAGLRKMSVGALVKPGDAITTVDEIRSLKLDFMVPERVLGSLSLGLPVTAQAMSFPEQKFTGKLVALDTRVDPVTRSVSVVAGLANAQLKLKPGMSMNVELLVEQRNSVVLIPEQALVPVGDQQFVFVVADNKVSRRPIQIGARHDNKVEVVSGLKIGETVVTRGTQKVRDGAAVRAQLEGAPAGEGAPKPGGGEPGGDAKAGGKAPAQQSTAPK